MFRDDVIFIIYMVQRRLYPVDADRPPEGYDEGDSGGAENAASSKPDVVEDRGGAKKSEGEGNVEQVAGGDDKLHRD